MSEPPTPGAPSSLRASSPGAPSSLRAPPVTGQPFGRYRLLEKIGRGGMAEVFKAKSFGVEGFEKVLVIKRIVPNLAAHPEFVEMFVQEAKLAVQLSHANIVQVFDLGRLEGVPPSYFMAMEYVAGVDLAAFLDHAKKAKKPLPFGLCVYVATEVARALDHAHKRHDEHQRSLGIVHRDVSPHNILLSWEGEVKVTDFGIAKAADFIAHDERPDDLEATRASGKLAFMSPEQSRSEHTDARSDLFSLGIVLYQMITGANPFWAPTPGETVRRINASEYPPIHLARPDTPQPLIEIVDRLLKKEPGDRYPDAAALSERLLAYAYTSGDRFGASDLAALLAPLRGAREEELEASHVFEEPTNAGDQTPVEIPHPSTPPPPLTGQSETGERREVSMLVLTFGGGDETAARPLAERVREVLDRHGAWIEEQSPSQVVAIFGLGDTDGRDAEAAVRAALVLVRERRFGAMAAAGVHSGAISVDDGGIPVRDERMLTMLATAQTLARATEGQVTLSPVTGRLVRRGFVTEPLPGSVRAVADGGLVVRRALDTEVERGKFVGRVNELKRLGAILASATRHQAQIVVVLGETGTGKSRLIAEAKRRLERGRYHVAFYNASCPANGASVPWSGLKAMLHVLCGTQEDDNPERILEVRPRLRALSLRDDEAASVLSLLGAPLRAKEIDARGLVRASFERMVQSLCHDQLHCFTWDDAQAIDRETLETVLRVTRHDRELRGVFLLSMRGDIPPALSKQKELEVIELDELDEPDTAKLVESLLGARALPRDILAYVRRCAGGHPLFVDELLRDMCDSGVVQVLNGVVTFRPESHATAPRTLRTLIADRVSRLQQRERRVLQGLAILGEPAFSPVLASVLEQALPTLDRHLTHLEGKGLVRRVGPTQVRFASPLYQEIVLDAMPAASRQELHARAADTYRQSALPGAGEADERVAEHLAAAGERREAAAHYWRSAQEKLEVGQLEASLRTMLRGLEHADVAEIDIGELLDWLEKIATTVSAVRQAPHLREALSPALRELEMRGDERQQAMAHIHAARALGSVNLFDDAYRELERAAPEGLADDELERARLACEAQLASRQGMFVRAAKAGDRLEAMGIEDPEALLTLVMARTMEGQTDAAMALLERIEKLAPASSVNERVLRQKHRVLIHFNARDWEGAARTAAEVAQLARNAGMRFDTAAALHNLGDGYDRLGDRPRAYAAFVESLEIAKELEHDRLANLNQMHLCLLDGLRAAEGAEERLKACIRHADARGYLWDHLEGRFLLARLAAAHGNHTRARQLLETILDQAKEHGHKLIGTDAEELFAKLTG